MVPQTFDSAEHGVKIYLVFFFDYLKKIVKKEKNRKVLALEIIASNITELAMIKSGINI